MKITVWQQFSSNHSSGFTIVGEFSTHDAAVQAAEQIRSMLQQIADWHEQHQEETHDWWSSGDWATAPSPPEKEFATQYGIAWQGAIDWFGDARVEVVLDRLVFIIPGFRPEADGQPFDQIMNRLGGSGYHEGNVYGETTGWIIFDLTCEAPDDTVANEIYLKHLGFNRRIKRAGLYLHFDRWRFDEDPELPALVEELRERGCSDIHYMLKQMPVAQPIELHNASDFDVLLEILTKSTHNFDRADAASVLGDIGDPRAVEPLIVALQSPDESLRQAAAGALGDLKDVRAVEPLLSLLTTPDSWTGRAVVIALEKIGDERAIEPLVSILQDDSVWGLVANTLAKIGEPAQKPLQKALASSNDKLRNRLETALRRLEETIAGGELLAALRNPDEQTRQGAFEQVKHSRDVDTMLAYLRNPGGKGYFGLEEKVIDVLVEIDDPPCR